MRRAIYLLPVAALLIAPWLMAPKCIDPDPRLTGAVDSGAGDATITSTSSDGSIADGGDAGITPAVACADPGEARIRIRDLSYQIQCGCEEASGKTCTIATGTRIVWIFADSEEHDVASVGSLFPPSGEKASGTFTHTFNTPGDYPYLCVIHSAEMSGYLVRVR